MPTPLRLILRSAVGFSESILRAIVGTHLPTSKLVSFLFIQLQDLYFTSIRFSKNIEVIWLILRVECEELSEEAVEVLKEVWKGNYLLCISQVKIFIIILPLLHAAELLAIHYLGL